MAPRITNYDQALNWLQGAKGQDAALSKDRSLYLWSGKVRLMMEPKSRDLIVYSTSGYSMANSPVILIYHTDGSITIPFQHQQRAWQGINNIIYKFSGGRINIMWRKRKLVVVTAADTRTPPKIQKCRGCAGTGNKPIPCAGPRISWVLKRHISDVAFNCISEECEVNLPIILEYNRRNTEARDTYYSGKNPVTTTTRNQYQEVIERAQTELISSLLAFEHPAHVKCDHGYTANDFDRLDWAAQKRLEHPSGKFNICYLCGGSGKRDYGNKQTAHIWNKPENLHIAADGTYLSGV